MTAWRRESPDQEPRAAGITDGWRLNLIGSFRLHCGRGEVRLRSREQRLVTLLAVVGGRPRSYLAGLLWPDSTESRARGNLRAAVWQLDQRAGGLLVHGFGHYLDLVDGLATDLDDFVAAAGRVAGSQGPPSPDTVLAELPVLQGDELLPGWYDDWVLDERAEMEQRRSRALEAAAAVLIRHDRLDGAVAAASAAVTADPLRETAQRLLIVAHLREGNGHLALSEYQTFRRRVLDELGVAPTPRLEALVRPLLAHAARD